MARLHRLGRIRDLDDEDDITRRRMRGRMNQLALGEGTTPIGAFVGHKSR
jgi:hypothetical protein